MSKFTQADSSVHEMAAELIRKYHPELHAGGATFDILMVHPETDQDGNAKGPAITHQGYPAAGLAKIVSLKDRAKGQRDGEIQIDAEAWGDYSDEQRQALLDHELQHFVVARDSYNVFQFDDLSRPKFRMRKHDVQIGWFDVIAQRHRAASGEVEQARELFQVRGQVYFTFITEGGSVSSDSRTAHEFREKMANIAGPSSSVTISGAGHSVTIPGK